MSRLLVISHPCVLPINQLIYEELEERDWEVILVVPERWRHEYSPSPFSALPLKSLAKNYHPLPTLFFGRPQRHIYLANASRLVKIWKPDVTFIEQEAFSMAAAQWALACRHHEVPFGAQFAENLDRSLNWLAHRIRNYVLLHASFIAARSPTAQKLAEKRGARGKVTVIPHNIPTWELQAERPRDTFTVGFAGRLVPEKGIRTLVEAVQLMHAPLRLLIVGDGPLRRWIESVDLGGGELRLIRGFDHGSMAEMYLQMDVLVLPSRTTPQWAEQFGRVLVEALSCGVPVVGSDSGDIPWVVNVTKGGRVFPEGNAVLLAQILNELRGNTEYRLNLAREGRRRANDIFGLSKVAGSLEEELSKAIQLRATNQSQGHQVKKQ